MNVILQDRVAKFFLDASWEDGRLRDLRRALHTWLQEGKPPFNGKLYVDPINKEEYSQMELRVIYDCECWTITDRLVPAKTIVHSSLLPPHVDCGSCGSKWFGISR